MLLMSREMIDRGSVMNRAVEGFAQWFCLYSVSIRTTGTKLTARCRSALLGLQPLPVTRL